MERQRGIEELWTAAVELWVDRGLYVYRCYRDTVTVTSERPPSPVVERLRELYR